MGGDGSGANREKERLDKINEILYMVRAEPVTKKYAIAQIMLKYGTSRRTTLEYINCLIDAEKIEEVEGLLQVKR
ncbi:hypothetical protein KAI30_04940 [Candidatus Bathyarchaeota archaeon]|nr:hypothetical protein [Candidatus Bathyarchaeota archaeon]